MTSISSLHKAAGENMITSSQFRLIGAQYGIFTPGLQFSITRVLSKLGERFDGPPIVLPFGDDAPMEIPRLILSSSDGKYKFQVSYQRADLVVTDIDEPGLDIGKTSAYAEAVIAAYAEVTHAIINRLAFVVKRAVPSTNAGLALATHFCRDQWLKGPLNRPQDFEVHAHKRYALSQWNVNSWMRCKTAKLTNNDSIILAEQDLNTLVEESENREFLSPDVQQFFSICENEFDSILNLYFPGDQT